MEGKNVLVVPLLDYCETFSEEILVIKQIQLNKLACIISYKDMDVIEK